MLVHTGLFMPTVFGYLLNAPSSWPGSRLMRRHHETVGTKGRMLVSLKPGEAVPQVIRLGKAEFVQDRECRTEQGVRGDPAR